jgi:hypothetical protein
MRKSTTTFLCFLFGWMSGFAQLPARSTDVTWRQANKVSATESPVIRKDRGPMSLVTVALQTPIRDNWNYSAEVSAIERFNTSGVIVAPRGKHISAYQALVRNFKNTSKAFPSAMVQASNFIIWNEKSFEAVTQQWDLSGRVSMRNGSSFSFLIQQRSDKVDESFSLGELEISSNPYRYHNFSLRYSGRAKSRFVPFVEVTTGSYYMDSDRYSIRVGERVKLTPKLRGFVDVEFSKVSGEVVIHGILTRLKLDYAMSKKISTGIFVVNNTFSEFNGLLAYVQFTADRHVFRMEYREVRDDFRFVESTHPFFSSNVLFQYRYSLVN